MGYAAAIAVVLLILRQRLTKASINQQSSILALTCLLPVVGLSLEFLRGSDEARQRLDVQFVGYRIPWSLIQSCSKPPDPQGKEGIWIGGGARGKEDPNPDVVVLPGYRSHLIELCTSGPKEIQFRAAEPGTVFSSTQNKVPAGLIASDGLHTQRVIMNALGTAAHSIKPRWNQSQCLATSTSTQNNISAEQLTLDLSKQLKEDRTAQKHTLKQRLRGVIPLPFQNTDDSVICFDTSQKDLRCGSNAQDPRRVSFAWLSDRKFGKAWDGLLADRLGWTACNKISSTTSTEQIIATEVPNLEPRSALTHSILQELPGAELRMISRRTVGNFADRTVPVSPRSFAPTGYRLGPSRRVRLASIEDNLLIISQESSSQIRLDDLAANRGNFEIVFSNKTQSGLLTVNLASSIDGHTTKTRFNQWHSSISVPPPWGKHFTIQSPSTDRMYSFGQIINVPPPSSLNGPMIEPLVGIRYIKVPTAAWLVPTIGSVLLLLGLYLYRLKGEAFHFRWDLVILGLFLFDFKFLLTTRQLLENVTNQEALEDWLMSGIYVLLMPCTIIVASESFSKSIQNNARPNLDFSFSGHQPPLATGLKIEILWLSTGFACCLAWLLLGHEYTDFSDIQSALTNLLDVGVQVLVILLTTSISIMVFGFIRRRLGGLSSTSSVPPLAINSTARGFSRRWLIAAVICGILALALRLLLYLLGIQESLPGGLKVDVFFLPIVAALLASISVQSEIQSWPCILGITAFLISSFALTGLLLSDIGLLWVGSMAIILGFPCVFRLSDNRAATIYPLFILTFIFLSPKFFPSPFSFALSHSGEGQIIANGNQTIFIPDPLQASRSRDYYRMMDAVHPELVETIPSQLAREVILERHRIRYQSLGGAWREGLSRTPEHTSSWQGAGLLMAKPLVGEATFRLAAKSDYVYQLYARAELGTVGVLGLLMLYAGSMAIVQINLLTQGGSTTTLALWSLAIATGTALFMLGGVNNLFPFSGKWSLFLAIGSRSDVCLACSLWIAGCTEINNDENT